MRTRQRSLGSTTCTSRVGICRQAHNEQFVNPFLRRHVGRVRRRRRDVEEERAGRVDFLLALHPRNGMIGEIVRDVIIRVSRARNPVMVLEEDGLKLAGVSGVEAVEVVEAQTAGPVVERTDFAGLPCRSVVVLADPRGRVAVLLEDLGYGPCTLGDDAGISVIASCCFGNDSRAGNVVIATGKQGCPRR